MANEITYNMDFSQPPQKLNKMEQFIRSRLKTLVNELSLQMQRHVREKYFGPYTGKASDNSLQRRSGMLSKSIQPIPAQEEGDFVKGGISIGTNYAKVQFGKKGQVTTIQGNPWLTIPLPAALNNQGIARGRARDEAVFGKTFIKRSKKGNLIIFGKVLYQKGAKAGQAKTEMLPLFVLKNQVDVKSRVHPEDIMAWAQPILGKNMTDLKNQVEGYV
jgi:hypothetical protein